jgi:hypothetical protein
MRVARNVNINWKDSRAKSCVVETRNVPLAAVVIVLKSRFDQLPVKKAKTSRAAAGVVSGSHSFVSVQLHAAAVDPTKRQNTNAMKASQDNILLLHTNKQTNKLACRATW